MIKKASPIFILSIAVILLGGCARQQPVYNVQEANIADMEQNKLSSTQVGKIISQAAIAKDWSINKATPGQLTCTTRWRQHSATILIKYSQKSYTIDLVSSNNLLENDGNIHRNYNKRVAALQNEIDKRLSVAGSR